MKPIRTWILAATVLLGCTKLAASETIEDAGEFMSMKVQYHTPEIGLIWAYECRDCKPVRFLFDKHLRVETRYGDYGPGHLKNIQDHPVVITWKLNTFQALRVLPMKKP